MLSHTLRMPVMDFVAMIGDLVQMVDTIHWTGEGTEPLVVLHTHGERGWQAFRDIIFVPLTKLEDFLDAGIDIIDIMDDEGTRSVFMRV